MNENQIHTWQMFDIPGNGWYVTKYDRKFLKKQEVHATKSFLSWATSNQAVTNGIFRVRKMIEAYRNSFTLELK